MFLIFFFFSAIYLHSHFSHQAKTAEEEEAAWLAEQGRLQDEFRSRNMVRGLESSPNISSI